jgi:DNA repair photolyase
LERKYKLTRQCLQLLIREDWPIIIQTRSKLILRDVDILKEAKNLEVGFSITTGDDDVRKLFEPRAPPISKRLKALAELHELGIKTYAMIAPILPGAERLAPLLAGTVDYILVDRMNYHYADFIYREHGLEEQMTEDYFRWVSNRITSDCTRLGIECTTVF